MVSFSNNTHLDTELHFPLRNCTTRRRPSARGIKCPTVHSGHIPAISHRRALDRLEKDGILPDVCLKSGSKSFYVHKDIVGSKSHSFKKLSEENATTKIFDSDTQNRHHLLDYIYTDIRRVAGSKPDSTEDPPCMGPVAR
ncbi:hypothetical protein AVEN_160171-1 [Araneus ventricosus]|uniref:BTB domain-containing protein n=1 Tax=Araneus ventricosus TaxID=182803 RepID=A0A4Y2V7Q1_ARAVE|nr:hypothetical protein AVEN_224530-1 [Araneus ventricosus]GBO21303.1 hypothetical protein AVEN_160171-1 [Araneus ventricosus]